ncbi:MAG: tRNA (guanosine(46)-N7)-methyltransferase TrmB [Opitutales bacterium]|nr:tRNA (guanosine(46)-N7)-methyltransferase TrmB [Opitutales bacterium]
MRTENGLELALAHRAARVENLKSEIAKLNYADFGGKITFEIGCGKGHYLSAYGAAHKGELCVGIDLISSRIRDGNRKNERLGNTNVHFLKAFSPEFLDAIPADLKLQKIFIFFPDPWPKKRHHKHRLIQPEFLSEIKKYCAPEAAMFFRTDHGEYFEWAMEIFAKSDWKFEEIEKLEFEEVSQFQRLLPNFRTLRASLKA